jgi:hypothetical protein
VVEFLEKAWQEPDDGIWEVRDGRRHFTHSKIMAWVAIDRVVGGSGGGFGGDEGEDGPHLSAQRADPTRSAARPGPRVGAFTQSYGNMELDASVLVTHAGFLPGSDRVQGTVAAIETSGRDGFVLGTALSTERMGFPDPRRVPGVQLLAGGQLRFRRTAGRRGGTVQHLLGCGHLGLLSRNTADAAAADRLPTGVLTPGADHRPDHRVGVANRQWTLPISTSSPRRGDSGVSLLPAQCGKEHGSSIGVTPERI